MLKSPFEKFTPKAIIRFGNRQLYLNIRLIRDRYIMYLPLNFIPVVGTAIFIFIQGMSYQYGKRLVAILIVKI